MKKEGKSARRALKKRPPYAILLLLQMSRLPERSNP